MDPEGQVKEGAKCCRGCYFKRGREGELSLGRDMNASMWPGIWKAFQGEGKAGARSLREGRVCPSPVKGRMPGEW